MEIFKDLFPLEDRWGKDGVFTPTNIVKDMIDLLPDSIWNPESTFIDISCKTGAFLAEIYTRLDTELSKLDEYKDPVKRRSHILNNQLFGLALRNDESLFFSRRNVFGDPFSDNIDVINAGNSSYLDLVKQKQYSIIETQLKGKFGRMRFDVVVGNPPYNNDIYLDFVTLGHHLSTQYTLMITPAKWQVKGGRKNEEFRKNIVPCMTDIIFYPDSSDVFAIADPGGIAIYIIDKSRHIVKTVTNISLKHLRRNVNIYNDKVKRPFDMVLSNFGWEIIHKINIDKQFKVTETVKNKRFQVYCGNKTNTNGGGGALPDAMLWGKTGIFLCLGVMNIVDTSVSSKQKAGVPDDSRLIFSSDNLNECESFISWAYTISTRFLLSISLGGLTGIATSDEWWRFVPNPNDWSVTYVDSPHPNTTPDEKGYYEYNGAKYCSLYVRYKLSKEDIGVIESIIKARK